MVLTLLMPDYHFAVVKDTHELKQAYTKDYRLVLIVDQPHASWVIPVVDQLKAEDEQLKCVFLAKSVTKLQKWRAICDIILCDWELGDTRIQQAIRHLTAQQTVMVDRHLE